MNPDKNGWIKIKDSESLPELGQKCFVWYSKNYLGRDDWCFTQYSTDDFGIDAVTHWRPVFEPPIKSRKSCQKMK